MTELYQIYYDDKQKEECYPFAHLHFNPALTHFFENTLIADLVPISHAEKVGVVSWKLRQKINESLIIDKNLTEDRLNAEFYVLAMTRNTKNHDMIGAAERWHPGFKDLLTEILKKVGFWVPGKIRNPIYFNHFVAKTDLYIKYIDELLLPVMNVMDTDEDIKKKCWVDSRYTNLMNGKAANPEELQKQIGVPYYPMHPFILERCFSIWCEIRKINVSYL